MTKIDVLWIWLIFINILAFSVYAADKSKAKRGKWRIRESTLLILAAVGGSVGAFSAMRIFHHKTKHKKFSFGVTLILALQTAAAAGIIILIKN